MACGKMSKDKYGEKPLTPGWDVSCMLNSVRCISKSLIITNERVTKILGGGILKHKAVK